MPTAPACGSARTTRSSSSRSPTTGPAGRIRRRAPGSAASPIASARSAAGSTCRARPGAGRSCARRYRSPDDPPVGVYASRVARVKVCGITRPEDAELAVDLGAWALGFILGPGRKRAAAPAVAAGIAARLRRRVALVGVFVNATLDEVARDAEALQLSHVQLHGDEGPAYCAEVGRR